MGKFDRWYHTVQVPYECGEGIVVSIPNQKYVINEAYPINNVVRPICLVDKSVFQWAHIYVHKIGSCSGTHCGTLHLYIVFLIKRKIVQFKDFLEDTSKGLGQGVFPARFFKFLLNNCESFTRLETSKVAKMQFSCTLPNSRNLLMKSVVSFMCDDSFSAIKVLEIRQLLTEDTTGLPGLLGL